MNPRNISGRDINLRMVMVRKIFPIVHLIVDSAGIVIGLFFQLLVSCFRLPVRAHARPSTTLAVCTLSENYSEPKNLVATLSRVMNGLTR